MKVTISTLHTNILEDKARLAEIDHWLSVMNRPNGWHYDIDHIWVLAELERNKILPGATILDAGAGYGILQYILAARGYNVISLDFSPRSIPNESKGIFNIQGHGDGSITYDHPYMHYMSYSDKLSKRIFKILSGKKSVSVGEMLIRIKRNIVNFCANIRARLKQVKYPTITFLRAPFHDIPLEANSIDAIVSISAIEHADIEIFEKNIRELSRLLKPDGAMFVTTGAIPASENVYNEQIRGWCFSIPWLCKMLEATEPSIDFNAISREFSSANVLKDRLDPYYWARSDSLFYGKNMAKIPYFPIGITIKK